MILARGHESELDLHQFLPPAYVSSEAVAVNDAGVIVGSANTADGYRHAVAWVPVDDFWITHDEPVLYKSASSLSVSATGMVTMAMPVPRATRVLVSRGTTSQTVMIPAGQFTGRFSLLLRFSNRTAGTSRWGFSGTLDGTVRHATLTLIRQASMPSPLPGPGRP
jgi:probable HAF family extracellular repeat protein